MAKKPQKGSESNGTPDDNDAEAQLYMGRRTTDAACREWLSLKEGHSQLDLARALHSALHRGLRAWDTGGERIAFIAIRAACQLATRGE